MTTSNLTPDEQRVYQSYLLSRFEKYWHQYTEGPDIFVPVILVSNVSKLFGLAVDDSYVMNGRLAHNCYEPHCDVQGKIMTVEGLKQFAAYNGFVYRKTYIDLLAAHRVFLYNYHHLGEMSFNRADMYNFQQLHQELYTAVTDYLIQNEKLPQRAHGANISIEERNPTGICYKELMDYLHYGASKPQVAFVISAGDTKLKCAMNQSDYQAQFSDVSYNIVIHNITIL